MNWKINMEDLFGACLAVAVHVMTLSVHILADAKAMVYHLLLCGMAAIGGVIGTHIGKRILGIGISIVVKICNNKKPLV